MGHSAGAATARLLLAHPYYLLMVNTCLVWLGGSLSWHWIVRLDMDKEIRIRLDKEGNSDTAHQCRSEARITIVYYVCIGWFRAIMLVCGSNSAKDGGGSVGFG